MNLIETFSDIKEETSHYMDITNLIVFAILIAFTAFFVATEFAIVKVRRTRVEQLAQEGNKNALILKKVIQNLDGYLSACQLGITITALGLGWIGEPTFNRFIEPIFSVLNLPESVTRTFSFLTVFGLVTFLHVVVGELAPKTAAIIKAEKISLLFARPLHWFYVIAFPLIWLLNGSARLLVRMFGMKPAAANEKAMTEEELRLTLSESYKSGEINQSELQFVNRIFEFDDRLAREIMVPRTEITCVFIDRPMKENLEIIKNEKYTRYPVAKEDKDHIIGLINAKEVFQDLLKNEIKPFEEYIRPIISVIEHIPIKELLVKMQNEGIHMAILVDEYGGTAGLVTVEDILEEIVGEIRDEFDIDEQPMIAQISPTVTRLDGKVLIEEVNEMFNLALDDSELDTIGGWMLSQLSNVELGSKTSVDGYEFKVTDVDGHQIKYIEVTKLDGSDIKENETV